MLARSVDGGITWLTNVAVDGDAENKAVSLGYVSVAADPEGRVGLEWPAANGACARFAISASQGRTFGAPVDLSSCEQSVHLKPEAYADNLDSVPVADPISGKSDTEKLGISIRLPFYLPSLGSTLLLVDGSGQFHPIWADTIEGHTQLFTRTVTVGKKPAPSFSLEGLTDVSKTVHVRLSNNNFYLGTSTFYADLSLLSGAEAICAPLYVVADGLRSDYGTAEIDNADNGNRGNSALWDMTDSLEHGLLRPWSASMPRTLSFMVKNMVVRDKGDALVAEFKVFGKSGSACAGAQ
jgi:hypothetical protein